MNTVLWVTTGVLAAVFLSGSMGQLLLPKHKYRALGPSQHWVDDFSAGHLKAIGAVKLTGVLGLSLPGLLGVVPQLVPIAACGLMLFMAGAVTTRFRRSEWRYMIGDLAFVSLFAFIAWGRFVIAPL